MKKITLTFLCSIAIFLIVYQPDTVSSGVKCGINLCLYQVIPSLLPLIIVTNIILYAKIGSTLLKWCYPLFHILYGVTRNGCFAMIISFLSGFPMGAQTISHLYEMSQISKKEAAHLMTFCNNASISFVINYLGIYCFKKCVDPKLLLLFIYVPPLLTGILNRYFFRYAPCYPESRSQKNNVISSSLYTLGKIIIYVICFSIIISLLQNTKIPYVNNITAVMEITTGLSCLTRGLVSRPKIYCAIICCVFGGFCSMFQAFSLILDTSLKKFYLLGKLEQLIISVLLLLCFL